MTDMNQTPKIVESGYATKTWISKEIICTDCKCRFHFDENSLFIKYTLQKRYFNLCIAPIARHMDCNIIGTTNQKEDHTLMFQCPECPRYSELPMALVPKVVYQRILRSPRKLFQQSLQSNAITRFKSLTHLRYTKIVFAKCTQEESHCGYTYVHKSKTLLWFDEHEIPKEYVDEISKDNPRIYDVSQCCTCDKDQFVKYYRPPSKEFESVRHDCSLPCIIM